MTNDMIEKDGPTANEVHVNAPLKNMSISSDKAHLTDDEIIEVFRKLLQEARGGGNAIKKTYPHEHSAPQHPELSSKVVGNKQITDGVRQLYALKDGKTVVESIRFSSAKFTPEEAKKWLESHGYSAGNFEPAIAKVDIGVVYCSNCGQETSVEQFSKGGLCVKCGDMEMGRQAMAKDEFEFESNILKADVDKQLIYGVVYPNYSNGEHDHQGDFAGPETIESMAHSFLVNSSTLDYQHRHAIDKSLAYPVESYLAPVDFEINGVKVTKGSWVMVTKINDPGLWQEIRKNSLGGYSIKGTGKRRPVTA